MEEILMSFSAQQRRIIEDTSRNKQVIAGAGSGKTRTVVGYVLYRLLQSPEESVLLLSFSRKAVHELRERIPEAFRSRVTVATFHAFCLKELKRNHPAYKGKKIQLLDEVAKNKFFQAALSEKRDEIGGVPYKLLAANPHQFRRRFPDTAMSVFRSFHKYKRDNDLVEFQDLIRHLVNALHESAPQIQELKNRYSLIIVDEFQDTDNLQLEFLRLMSPKSILAVGDDWQAIYSFRGASLGPFFSFKDIFKARIFRLSENYRSLSSIVKIGRHAISRSSRQISKSVRSTRGKGPGFPVLSFTVEPGREFSLYEAAGGNCRDIKILARSNFRLAMWRQAGFEEASLSTIHKAKGLEFPAVFLDLTGGWSSPEKNRTRENLDEEIRILYVGLSRAMDLLVVLHRAVYSEEDPEKELWESLCERTREVNAAGLKKYLSAAAKFREEF